MLIRKGADVNPRDNKGRTPLHRAPGYDALAAASLLIESGADVNVKDEDRLTPIEWARREKSLSIAKLLDPHTSDLITGSNEVDEDTQPDSD